MGETKALDDLARVSTTHIRKSQSYRQRREDDDALHSERNSVRQHGWQRLRRKPKQHRSRAMLKDDLKMEVLYQRMAELRELRNAVAMEVESE